MQIQEIVIAAIKQGIKELYITDCDDKLIQIQKTRKEFDGDITLVVFPLLKTSKKSPEQTGDEIGNYLIKNTDEITQFNVIKGFLNLVVADSYWLSFLNNSSKDKSFGTKKPAPDSPAIMVEYSSPNTNKPLHLGHIRNNLLGYSISNILKANGHNIIKTNLVNDRGIHICKSMLAWQKWGKKATPESTGKKGDHLVGDYYVKFDQEYKKEIDTLIKSGLNAEEAAKKAPLILEAQEMLRKWEAGDKAIVSLWETMNQWVYDGFDKTYKALGVDFDSIDYESKTYSLGKALVMEGLKKGILYKRDDGSIWADLTKDGLDEKLLLRADGTSVYMTQDLGTAHKRFTENNIDELVYVVGNEQNYHFQVLSLILDKLGFSWAKSLTHLSYGMVDLPSGKMKSREGTVVDADDIIEEMITTSRAMAAELGKLEGYSDKEKENIFRIIGLGALKYFILKVDPKKNMTFNPEESVDFNGNTGPFIQYTYARILSVLRKAEDEGIPFLREIKTSISLVEKEKSLLKLLHEYPEVVKESAETYNPSLIANYTYELVKEYNQFYHDYSIIKEEKTDIRDFRLLLSSFTATIITQAMALLGIEVPERM
ncbi:MAG: arginine--tRNA ligase [Bacteroidales bacterium]|nr:arginine--tRNA ligase [Bacteroidales bacterium]